jgi:hypothetical protein
MASEFFDVSFRSSVRRAYERGRARGAAVRGAGVLLLGLPAFVVCGRTAGAAVLLAGLAVVAAAARHRGEGFEEGARAGVAAGILPCLLPAALRLVRPDLCDLLFARGPWLCAAAGVAAGAILGFRSRARHDLPFWAAALATLVLAAALGCLPAGTMGFAGLAAGLAAGGIPALASRRSPA